jgi:hypothetical protein
MKIDRLRRKLGPIVEGPLGYLMPEAIARTVDELTKTLPRECHYRRKAHSAQQFSFDAGEMADVSFITTDSVDREGEVFLPGGGDWSDYNRVVTWCHAYGPVDGWVGLPVAACIWMKPKRTAEFAGILAKTRYYNKPDDWGRSPWLPTVITAMQRQNPPGCTGKSIGCIPLSMREATREEIATRPQWEGKPIFDRWLGLEYAVCPVPMNPACELEAVAKMLRPPAPSGFKRHDRAAIDRLAIDRLVAERLAQRLDDRLARAMGLP